MSTGKRKQTLMVAVQKIATCCLNFPSNSYSFLFLIISTPFLSICCSISIDLCLKSTTVIIWPNYYQFSSPFFLTTACLQGNYTEVFEISKFNARVIDVGRQMYFWLRIQGTSFHFMRFRSFSTARCHILRKRLNSLHFVIKWPLSIIFIRCYRSILRCNNQVINWLYD